MDVEPRFAVCPDVHRGRQVLGYRTSAKPLQVHSVGGRRQVDSTDIRRALKLYRVADFLLIGLFGLISIIVIVA